MKGRLPSGAVAAIALAVSVVGLGACSSTASASPSPKYKIATHPSGVVLAARLDTTLQGQANSDGTACFWVADGSGRMALEWPNGFTAKANPLSVYDDRGVRAAVVGSHLTAAGGLEFPDFRGPLFGCVGSFAEFWMVDGVLINGVWHPD
jgi:hypothetical protein